MKYVIVTQSYVPTSAGIKALYRLRDDLDRLGHQARIIASAVYGEAEWGKNKVYDEEIVIYPDCFCGNPLKAKNVVRFLLMFAGYFGQDKDFPESEMMYYHSPEFVLNNREPDNICTIPVVDLGRFPYIPPRFRSGVCYLAIKYKSYFKCSLPDLPPDCEEITVRTNLPRLFSHVKTLISFDNSAINLEAMLSGIDVEYRFNEKFEKPIGFGDYLDVNRVRESCAEIERKYRETQLPLFVERTKERFFSQ